MRPKSLSARKLPEQVVKDTGRRRDIAAKVKALVVLCYPRAARLAATAASRRRLLDARLSEVPVPPDERELEAAK